VIIQIGSEQGGTSTTKVKGTIYDLLDVQGFLEDNEQHLRQPGIVKIHNINNGNNVEIGEMSVDNSGQFNKRFNKRIVDLTDSILIQGRKIDPLTGQEQSYIRTIKLPRGDVNGLEMVVVPYDGLGENGITPEDFSRHMREVLTADGTNGKGTVDALTLNPIITKWDFGIDPKANNSLEEIIISKHPNDSTVNAYFSQTTADNIKNRILDPNDMGSWFRGKITDPNQIRIVENYDVSQLGEEGKIDYYPSKNQNTGSFSLDFYTDINYISFGIVIVSTNSSGEITSPGLLAHEAGHASGLIGHAEILPQEKTIMRRVLINANYSTPRFADIKTAKAIYEDTYIHGQGRNPDGLLRVDDILGFKWADE
jgi:hypothetical protein